VSNNSKTDEKSNGNKTEKNETLKTNTNLQQTTMQNTETKERESKVFFENIQVDKDNNKTALPLVREKTQTINKYTIRFKK
jgi:hypothetical protein